jgi:hypothetical protein
MRHPLTEAGRLLVGALRDGRPGREGLLRALPDVPAALRARRPLPPQVLADLQLLRTS